MSQRGHNVIRSLSFKVSRLLLCVAVCSTMVVGDDSGRPSPAGSVAAGVSFVDGSTSQVIIEKDGKRYLVDVTTHQISEIPASDNPAALSSSSRGQSAQDQKPEKADNSNAPKATRQPETVYRAGDDFVFNLPTGRRVDRHGLYIDFTHRFPYEPAFSTPGRGNTLLGLDDFAVPSFGFRYGLTSRLYAFAYRSPSVIGRPIELMLGYNMLDEHDGNPLNLAARFSIDGQNNFQRNFAENFELIASRSLGHRAQLYAVPTFTVHARPLLQNLNPTLADAIPYQPCSAPLANGISGGLSLKPCSNTFSLGIAAAVDIRKTAALVAEVTPTLMNATDLGIHRPEFAFGIQKKIWRHAFTLGFGNGPATIVSQRAGTDSSFLGSPSADKPSKVFIGFDLSRQAF